MKKIILSSILILMSISLSACKLGSTKESATRETSRQTSATNSETSTTTTSSLTETSLSSTGEKPATDLSRFIGDWELNIPGQEGWFLTIAPTEFQFYRLYNGHVDAPNLENVSYSLSEDGSQLTLVGDRLTGNSIRGEALENDKARDTLVATLVTDKDEHFLKVHYDQTEASLSTGDTLFKQISPTPNIVPWPPS